MNENKNKDSNDTIETPYLSEIENFPFKTHSEFVSSIKSGYSTVGIEYTAARELININKPKLFATAFKFVIWLPNILILLSVVLALLISNWFMLIGMITAFLGEFFANPYNPLKKIFIFFTFLAYGYLFYDQSILHPIGWLCFSFAVSFSTIWAINRIAWKWAYNDMLKSEVLTANLYLTGNLHIKLKDGQYYSNRK